MTEADPTAAAPAASAPITLPHQLRAVPKGGMGRLEHLRFGDDAPGWTFTFGESGCFVLSNGLETVCLEPHAWFALVELLEPHVRQARTGPLRFDADLYEIKEPPMTTTPPSPAPEPDPSSAVLRCCGCGITSADIIRFKLQEIAIGSEGPTVPVFCSRCRDNPITLTRVLAQRLAGGAATVDELEALLLMRDRVMLEESTAGLTGLLQELMVRSATTPPSASGLAAAAARVQLDPDGDPAKSVLRKPGIAGAMTLALFGAVSGFALGFSENPIEMLHSIAERVQSLSRQALDRIAAGGQ
jgi:hypothetical protein